MLKKLPAVGKGQLTVASYVKVHCLVDPSIHHNLLLMWPLLLDIEMSPSFAPIIITSTTRWLCQLNVNICSLSAFAENTDATRTLDVA